MTPLEQATALLEQAKRWVPPRCGGDVIEVFLASRTPAQPATPEPSAERITPAMLAEFEGGKEQRDVLRALLESAESQLAAVHVLLRWLDQRGGLGIDVHERIRALLTPATTPGAGGGK